MIFRKIIPYFLYVCFCSYISAQNSKLDSLEQVLASGVLKDVEKAELLTEIAHQYRRVDIEKSKTYALEAISFAQKIGLKRVEADGYIALANYYRFISDTAKHRLYVLEALKIVQSSKGLEPQEASVYFHLGHYNLAANRHYLAYINYKKAEKLMIKLDDKKRLKPLYESMIALFYDIADTNNVIYYADKLIEIAVETNDMTQVVVAQVFKVLSNETKENVLDNLIDLFQKSINNDQNIDLGIKIYLAQNCGNYLLEKNNPNEALYYLHWARQQFEADKNPRFDFYRFQIFVHLAEAYAALNKPDSAEYYIKKSEEVAILRATPIETFFQTHSDVEAAKGNYKKALEIYKQYHHFSDSLQKTKRSADVARMKNWHELEHKDNQNSILQQEKQKQFMFIMILTGALAIIIVLFIVAAFFQKKTKEKNSELKKLHSVKDRLFSVVSHDLRSPMNALASDLKKANKQILYAETQTQVIKEISSRVVATYYMIDNLLRWSKSQIQGLKPSPTYFSVYEEVNLVIDSLRDIAAAKKINIINRIESNQVYTDKDMFKVVLHNLMMNAVKYNSFEGAIFLKSELIENKMIISVKDNGTGMTQEVQEKLFNILETKTSNETGTGLGLVLCADFVKANGGQIWFTSEQGKGSTFYFSIKLKKE